MSSAEGGDEGPSLWEELIKQYVAGTNEAEQRDCNLVILGNASSGARSLLARMAGKDIDDAYEGFALEYDSIDIRHEDDNEDENDIFCKINVWHVETPAHSDLLKVALPPEALAYSIVIILTDLSVANTVMEHVEEWAVRLVDYLKECWKTQKASKKAEMEDKILQHLAQIQKEAKEKAQAAAATQKKRRQRGMSLFSRQENVTVIRPKEEEKKEEVPEVQAQLGAGMLTTNFGMPVIVVGTKSDAVEDSGRAACKALNSPESNVKQVLAFMQGHLRKWCLAHGAGLVFTSSRKDTGIDLLMEYLKNRAFGFQLQQEMITNRHENIFVPFGYDSLEDIKKLNFDAIGSLDTNYSIVIHNPNNPKKAEGGGDDAKQGKSLKSILQKKFMLSASVKAFKSASEDAKVEAMDHQTFLRRQIELQKMRERTEYMSAFREFASGGKKEKNSERERQKAEILAQVKAEEQSQKGNKGAADSSDTRDAAQFFATMMKTYNSFRKTP